MAAGETRADTAQKYSLRPVNKSIEFHDDFVDGGSGGGLFLRRSKRKTIGIAIAAGIPAKTAIMIRMTMISGPARLRKLANGIGYHLTRTRSARAPGGASRARWMFET